MDKVITALQEVLFDLCDLLEANDLSEKIEGFSEFVTMREFIIEQRSKVAVIETRLAEEGEANGRCVQLY